MIGMMIRVMGVCLLVFFLILFFVSCKNDEYNSVITFDYFDESIDKNKFLDSLTVKSIPYKLAENGDVYFRGSNKAEVYSALEAAYLDSYLICLDNKDIAYKLVQALEKDEMIFRSYSRNNMSCVEIFYESGGRLKIDGIAKSIGLNPTN